MITIRTGSYTQTEKENLAELFFTLSQCVCNYCDAKTGVTPSVKCRNCEYRHIKSDMRRVDCPKKNDNSVT